MKNKLSSRFKKKDKIEEKTEPKKFVFKKNDDVVENESSQQDNIQINVPEELPIVIEPQNEVLEQKDLLRQELFEKIESVPVWFEYSTEKQKELVRSFVQNKDITGDKDEIVEKLYSEINGFGAIDYLISQDNVSAVLINGTKSIHIEIAGKVLNTEMKLCEKELNFLLNNIFNKVGIKSKKPLMNFKINDLFVNIIMPEISTCGVNISIRKNVTYDLKTFIDTEIVTDDIYQLLLSAVVEKKNIVISGDINSGKTVLLNMLINSVVKNKRSVLLEETPQIQSESDSLIKFLINKKSDDYNMLIANLLKMSPEYIVTDYNASVPEITERKGVISTLRAYSVDAAIMKLTSEVISFENLPEKFAKTKVLTDFDYIVQINKTEDGISRITSIVELSPARTAALSVKSIVKYVDGKYVKELLF